MELTFEAIHEDQPGSKWQALFNKYWPGYQRWFLSEGDAVRPTYLKALGQLRQHMPELVPTYERLTDLAGGGDLAARFLALYRPPPYLSGCTQAVWPADEHFLIRNYDYSPDLLEGTILCTAWNGRRVIAMCDGAWGVIDGINEAGLAVSLAFGGRRVVRDGFGIPIILRYVLEFCETTREAVEVLCRVPTHMAYNITLLDCERRFETVFVSPDRAPVVRRMPVATNHQGRIEWHRHAWATATLEREQAVASRLADCDETGTSFIAAFLEPPLYNTAYERGFGTLFTAVYRPHLGRAEYLWPDRAWTQSFEKFEEGTRTVRYRAGKSAIP